MLVERYHKDTDLPSAEWKEIGPKGSDGSERSVYNTPSLQRTVVVQPSRTKGDLVARPDASAVQTDAREAGVAISRGAF